MASLHLSAQSVAATHFSTPELIRHHSAQLWFAEWHISVHDDPCIVGLVVLSELLLCDGRHGSTSDAAPSRVLRLQQGKNRCARAKAKRSSLQGDLIAVSPTSKARIPSLM